MKEEDTELPYGIKIENQLNENGDDLPFGYYDPSSGGKVTWNCGYDQNSKITSVFSYRDGDVKDRKIGYLNNLNEALDAREQLINAGWLKLSPPKITFSYGDDDKKDMNRKQKRELTKEFKNMVKNNPYKT